MTMRVRKEAIHAAINPDLRDLLAAVQSLPCSDSRRSMMRTLRNMAGRRLYIARREVVAGGVGTSAPDQLALAVDLLNQRMRVADCRDALMIRLTIGKTAAYKLIGAALQARAGVVPATAPQAAGLRQLALALEDERD